MKSIIQTEKICFVCGKTKYLESHHCFGGNPNRKNSEKYGLKVWLCPDHHTGQHGVHNGGELMDMLHKVGQKAFEETHSHEEFMKIFGKNYL